MMRLNPGDVLQMKKSHPCGGDRFTVLRAGLDVRLRCERCGHEFLLSRAKTEKGIKQNHFASPEEIETQKAERTRK